MFDPFFADIQTWTDERLDEVYENTYLLNTTMMNNITAYPQQSIRQITAQLSELSQERERRQQLKTGDTE